MASTALNVVVVATYLAIALTILRGLVRAGRVWSNPLMLATSAIFLAGAAHHGSHLVHLIAGWSTTREALDVWHATIWDVFTAGAGIWYLLLRDHLPVLARGSAQLEVLRERERQALEIHDNVVQGLAEAQLAFDVGREQQARDAVDRTLAAARQIITDLLGEPGSGIELGAGDLRRSAPADQRSRERYR